MKKISEHLGAIITTIVAIAACIAVVVAVGAGPTTVFFGEIVDKETDIAQEIMDNMETPQIVVPDVNVSSTMLLTNRNGQMAPSASRAISYKFLNVPVEAGSTLNITNNSTDYKIAIHGLKDNGSDYSQVTDSGYINPNSSNSVTLTSDETYFRIMIAMKNTTQDIDISKIDLSDFKVTYTDSSENLLDGMYNKAKELYGGKLHLKNFNSTEIRDILKNVEIYAHKGAFHLNSTANTLAQIKNAVEVEGFDNVEVDIRVTSDNKFVLYHDVSISGAKIAETTYDELVALKNDLATVEEVLEYCSNKNLKLLLDLKVDLTEENLLNLLSLVELYNMEDKFNFCIITINNVKQLPEKYHNVSFNNTTNISAAVALNIGRPNLCEPDYCYNLDYFYNAAATNIPVSLFDNWPNTNKMLGSVYFINYCGAELSQYITYENINPETVEINEKYIIRELPYNFLVNNGLLIQ